MNEWIVLANRAQVKIFEKSNSNDELHWIKTIANKKERWKESETSSGGGELSFSKSVDDFPSKNLNRERGHAEVAAMQFVNKVSRYLEKSFREKRFEKLSIYAGTHLLEIFRIELAPLNRQINIQFENWHYHVHAMPTSF